MIANKRNFIIVAFVIVGSFLLVSNVPEKFSVVVTCPTALIAKESSSVPVMSHFDKESCRADRNTIITHTDRPYRFFLHPVGKDTIISDSVLAHAATGQYFEEGIRATLFDLLKNKPNAVVLDIGANIGLHTLYLASMGYEVHAFEPHPANNRLLACSIIYNDFNTIKFNPFGLSLEEAEACIETDESYNQGHAVVNELNTGACKTSIKVKRLDTYLETNKVKPYVVKIDVEGYELRALSSAKEYFRANPPAVFLTEYSQGFMKTAGSDPKAYFDFFWDLGYEIKTGNDIVPKNSDISNIPMTDLYIYRADLL